MDMKTVLISYLITDAICAGVIGALYWQNRKQFKGLGFWLADFVMQFSALLLVAMRGMTPDFVSMVIGNGLVIGGTILLYMGLEQFTDRRGAQWHNALLFILFISVHSYFAVIVPDLTARNINLALTLFAICAQCAWLLLRRVDVMLRPITRDAGLVFIAYSLVNAARIGVDLAIPSAGNLFHSNLYDTSAVMVYQMLFIALTFSLFLMVNRRLLLELQEDIIVRQRTEEALRFSEEKFFKAFHASPDAVAITREQDGHIVEVNESFLRFTGYARDEVLHTTTVALQLWANPQDRKSFIQKMQREHFVHNTEYDFRAKSGALINGLVSAEIIQLGNESHIISVIHNITGQKEMEAALRASEVNMRSLIENVKDVFVRYDLNLRYQYVSPVIQRFLDATPESFIGKTHQEAGFSEKQAEFFDASLREAIQSKKSVDVEFTLQGRGGEYIMQTRVYPELDEKGAVISVVTVTSDVTERKRAETQMEAALEELRESEAHFREVFDNTAHGTFIIDINGDGNFRIGDSNKAEEILTAIPREAVMGKSLDEAFPPNIAKMLHANYSRAIETGEAIAYEEDINLPGVGLRSYYTTLAPVKDKTGRFRRIVGSTLEITERRKMEDALRRANETLQTQIGEINALQETLREQAMRDPLTGLHNRRYLSETIEREIARAKREDYPISVMIIDVDHFKGFNDTYGHNFGDKVLGTLSALLQDNIRVGDIACRYGGDEFVVIMPGAEILDAKRRGETIHDKFSAESIKYGGMEVIPTVSIGISVYPQHGEDGDAVFRSADAALYQAKEAGRNRVQAWQTR